ncbi:MAG TPA: (Fe-S)-binding protein [Anaerolineae bacterium]|nr:(Fe-S)-binding protein [Anaerolineae bacterium]
MENADYFVLDDELWEELLALTDGEAAPCFQCGVCTASCPWGLVRGETFSVRKLIRQVQLGTLNEQEDLWLCTTCSQCEPYCPRGVPVVEIIQALRYMMWKRRAILEGLPSLLWSVYWNNNPWFQPPSQRTQWALTLDLPTYDPDHHDILLYIGCTASYDRRAQNLAHSLIQILRAFQIPFGVLGEDEPCCGETILRLGHLPYFKEIAEAGAKIFRDRGVGKLVAISPHCYDVFLNHYPEVNRDFEPLHYTEYLASVIETGGLKFQKTFDRKVTYHDPCYLGRRNQGYEAPRKILESIPGVTLVEMENSGMDALCCGGGGGRMWMETAPGERFSDLRVQEAAATGANVIATACPFCITCLEDGVKSMGIEGLEVLDIVEIAAQVLQK